MASSPEQLALFTASLGPSDRVVLDATGNAESRVKTDKVDPRVLAELAELLAADIVPRAWIGDEQTRMLRQVVLRRRGLVKRRTHIKNEIQAVLHRNLKVPAGVGPVR